jgi:hypothetical protein
VPTSYEELFGAPADAGFMGPPAAPADSYAELFGGSTTTPEEDETERRKQEAAVRLTKLLGEQYPDLKPAEARTKFASEAEPSSPGFGESAIAGALGLLKTAGPAAGAIGTGTLIGGPVGLLASLPIAYGLTKAQSAGIEAIRPGAQEELATVAEEHPVADFAGGLAPSLGAFGVGVPKTLATAGVGAGVGAGLHAIGSLMEGEAPGLGGTALAAALGTALKPRAFLHGPAPKAVKAEVKAANPGLTDHNVDILWRLSQPVDPLPGNPKYKGPDPTRDPASFSSGDRGTVRAKKLSFAERMTEEQADFLWQVAQPAEPLPGSPGFKPAPSEANVKLPAKYGATNVVQARPEGAKLIIPPENATAAGAIYKKLMAVGNRRGSVHDAERTALNMQLEALGRWEAPEPTTGTMPAHVKTYKPIPARERALQDATRAMEEEFGRPLSTPERTQVEGLADEGLRRGASPAEAATAAVEAAKVLPRPPGPETMAPGEAAARGIPIQEQVNAAKAAYAAGKPAHPELLESIPEVKNAQEVIADLPKDPASGRLPAPSKRMTWDQWTESQGAKGISKNDPRYDSVYNAFIGMETAYSGSAMRGLLGTPSPERGRLMEPKPPRPLGAPALPDGMPGYRSARSGYEPGTQTWEQTRQKVVETVEALGGTREAVAAFEKGGTTPEAVLAHAYNASDAQSRTIKAALGFDADPSPENMTVFKEALRNLEAAQGPLRGQVTDTARALSILRGVKGTLEHGEEMLSIAQVADKIGRRTAPRQAPPRGRRGQGAGQRGKGSPPVVRKTGSAPTPDEEARFLLQVAQQIGAMQSPKDIALAMGTKVPASLTRGEKIGVGAWEYLRNAMLSAPRTQLSVVSDLVMMVARPVETLGTAAVGTARAAIGLKGSDRAYFGEAPAQIMGMIGSVPEALHRAKLRFAIEPVTNIWGEGEYRPPVIPGRLGKAIRIPQRLLQASTDVSAHMFDSGETYALAYRQAAHEGLVGDAFASRVAALRADPLFATGKTSQGTSRGSIASQAKAVGLEGSWQSKNSVADKIGVVKSWTRIKGFSVLEPLIPFMTVRLNMMAATMKRIPGLNAALPSTRADWKAGGVSQDQVISRMLAGATVGGWLMYNVRKGNIEVTGDRPRAMVQPEAYAQQNAKQAPGWQAHSIRLWNHWIEMRNLPVFGDFVRLTSEFSDAYDNMNEESASAVALSMASSLGKWVENVPFLSDAASVSGALLGEPRAFKRLTESLATMPIPRLVSSVAFAMDGEFRKTQSILDAWKKNLPGLSKELPAWQNVYGEPEKSGDSAFVRFVTPFRTTAISNDPVKTELKRLKMHIGMPSQTIDGYKMTPKEYEAYVEEQGKLAYDLVSANVVDDWDWKNLEPSEQKDRIKRAFDDSRQQARNLWREDHPKP